MWTDVVETYMSSLAAACVFEYVMGLGDRFCKSVFLFVSSLSNFLRAKAL